MQNRGGVDQFRPAAADLLTLTMEDFHCAT